MYVGKNLNFYLSGCVLAVLLSPHSAKRLLAQVHFVCRDCPTMQAKCSNPLLVRHNFKNSFDRGLIFDVVF